MSVSAKNGFSLIEMSVVLIVVSLVAAAIIQTGSMITQAKVRSVIQDLQQYRSIISTFNGAYQLYPGDFDEAERFWPPTQEQIDAGITRITENGDGDGNIAFDNGTVYEGYRAWQHLSLAEMMTQDFAGTQEDDLPRTQVAFDNDDNKILPDVPAIRMGGALLLDSNAFGFASASMLIFGRPFISNPTLTFPLIPALRPGEAMDVDIKLDDGNPRTGLFRADKDGDFGNSDFVADSPDNCLNENDLYDTETDQINCIIALRLMNVL